MEADPRKSFSKPQVSKKPEELLAAINSKDPKVSDLTALEVALRSEKIRSVV